MERKVLFTASTYSHILQFHLPYLREFQRMGWRVDAACGGPSAEISWADRVIPVPFEKRMAAAGNLAALRRLRREISREKYDLVICHTSLASFFTRMAVRGLHPRPAVVCMVHGYLFDDGTSARRRALLSGAEQLTAPVTDLLLTMNSWDLQYARAHHLGKTVAFVPGIGVEFDRLDRADPSVREELRRAYGIGPEDFLLIYAAEFSPRKNQAVLLHALARLPRQVKLLLPGQGALRENCVSLAGELGLSERAIFPGQIAEIAPWYFAADGAVSASRSEGLPFNIMEAMYRELPVVASAVKGHEDLLVHGETGLLYPYGDVEACAECVRSILEDPQRARRLGAAASLSARRYSLDRVLPEVMTQYGRLVPLGESWNAPVPV